jgi:hypothetical protein
MDRAISSILSHAVNYSLPWSMAGYSLAGRAVMMAVVVEPKASWFQNYSQRSL